MNNKIRVLISVYWFEIVDLAKWEFLQLITTSTCTVPMMISIILATNIAYSFSISEPVATNKDNASFDIKIVH